MEKTTISLSCIKTKYPTLKIRKQNDVQYIKNNSFLNIVFDINMPICIKNEFVDILKKQKNVTVTENAVFTCSPSMSIISLYNEYIYECLQKYDDMMLKTNNLHEHSFPGSIRTDFEKVLVYMSDDILPDISPQDIYRRKTVFHFFDKEERIELSSVDDISSTITKCLQKMQNYVEG